MTIKNDLIPVSMLIYNKIKNYLSSIDDYINYAENFYRDIILSAGENLTIKMNIENRAPFHKFDQIWINENENDKLIFRMILSEGSIDIKTNDYELSILMDPSSNKVTFISYIDSIRNVEISSSNGEVDDKKFVELSKYEFKELIEHLNVICNKIDHMEYNEELMNNILNYNYDYREAFEVTMSDKALKEYDINKNIYPPIENAVEWWVNEINGLVDQKDQISSDTWNKFANKLKELLLISARENEGNVYIKHMVGLDDEITDAMEYAGIPLKYQPAFAVMDITPFMVTYSRSTASEEYIIFVKPTKEELIDLKKMYCEELNIPIEEEGQAKVNKQ